MNYKYITELCLRKLNLKLDESKTQGAFGFPTRRGNCRAYAM